MMILLIIYFCINGFIAGYAFGTDEYNKWIIPLSILFGVPVLIICWIIGPFFNRINHYFLIVPWYEYMFTHKWNNLNKETLDYSNKLANKPKGLKGVIHRSFIKLVNKRNNGK